MIQKEDNPDVVRKWIEAMTEFTTKIRPTKSWKKFRHYFETWLSWLEKQFCQPHVDGNIDCICYKAKRVKISLEDYSIAHCNVKENTCKNYCLKYCDYFAFYYDRINHFNPSCPDNLEEDPETGDTLLPYYKDVDEYLENYSLGKMCLL